MEKAIIEGFFTKVKDSPMLHIYDVQIPGSRIRGSIFVDKGDSLPDRIILDKKEDGAEKETSIRY